MKEHKFTCSQNAQGGLPNPPGSLGFRIVRMSDSPTCWGRYAKNPNKFGIPLYPLCKLAETYPPFLVWLLVLTLLLAGCGGQSASLADFFPDADTLPDWTTTREVELFDSETIFDLVNGQADAFFAYGFEQVAVQSYENAEGAVVGVEVWQLATPADAYGLFSTNASGEPAAIGNEGSADPGRRLAFWQDRYYVHVRARQELDDAVLREFAVAISAALPSGGERPALVDRLPLDGMAEGGALFFHEEISIQQEVWLGGENLLGLSPETDGVLARYEVGGATARLVLIQYPDAEGALAALAVLEGGQVDGLARAGVRGNLLGAVFGEVGVGAADGLLGAALGDG